MIIYNGQLICQFVAEKLEQGRQFLEKKDAAGTPK